MEGVHDNVHNQVTYHTSENCYLVPPTSTTPLAQNLTGWVTTTDCYAYSPDVGCAVIDPSVASYGTQFNILGGGVFAMMWLDDSVRVWFFHRSSIPPDIQTNSPKPSTWGTPTSFLGNGCDIPSHFWNHQLVFDITFCGVWAGSSYVSSGCPGTCSERVQQPSNFVNASWTINYVHVFGSPGISGGNVTSSAPATRPSGSSTIIKLLTFGIGALGIQTLYTL
ncbi:hypothetical protein DL93DRAFT_2072719 [Clavulina sp. PMI_390]|nr:hypothetical protein DL93DRAFT_2072719 [Clavulina sp. PMI_390]